MGIGLNQNRPLKVASEDFMKRVAMGREDRAITVSWSLGHRSSPHAPNLAQHCIRTMNLEALKERHHQVRDALPEMPLTLHIEMHAVGGARLRDLARV